MQRGGGWVQDLPSVPDTFNGFSCRGSVFLKRVDFVADLQRHNIAIDGMAFRRYFGDS